MCLTASYLGNVKGELQVVRMSKYAPFCLTVGGKWHTCAAIVSHYADDFWVLMRMLPFTVLPLIFRPPLPSFASASLPIGNFFLADTSPEIDPFTLWNERSALAFDGKV